MVAVEMLLEAVQAVTRTALKLFCLNVLLFNVDSCNIKSILQVYFVHVQILVSG